ncbi:MAG TPA: class I SAM-dependent methyltransferase [Opitutaceae bacterium]|nr:class I SAM-dependent methyltransferase [Opitutaceae bacterium]
MESIEYRKMAEVEDTMWYYRALHVNLAGALIRHLRVQNAAVLDAGCGTGGFLRHLARKASSLDLTGVDFSPLAIELARERAGPQKFAVSDIAALRFATETFDAVVSADVICQIAEPQLALLEIQRVLKKDGLLLLNLPAYEWLYSYHDKAVGNLRRYSRRPLLRTLRASGFTPLAHTYWNSLPLPLVIARRKLFSNPTEISDVQRYPAPLEFVFRRLMNMEHAWMQAGFRLPFGCSLLVVARKSS